MGNKTVTNKQYLLIQSELLVRMFFQQKKRMFASHMVMFFHMHWLIFIYLVLLDTTAHSLIYGLHDIVAHV